MNETDTKSFQFDFSQEALLPASRFVGLVEQLIGHRPSAPTIWRWRNVGLLSKAGETVKLPSLMIGSNWYSSLGAFTYFLAALNDFESGPMFVPADGDHAVEPEPTEVAVAQ